MFDTIKAFVAIDFSFTVHDAGELVDNVADSADESEDEWNYFKGDEANKENSNSSEPDAEVIKHYSYIFEDFLHSFYKQVAAITGQVGFEVDKMSQLNPDAAEFVPVSPTRSFASPVCSALINEQVLAQSPQRCSGTVNDIKLPDLQEFETEVKSRPSEMECSNGHENENVSIVWQAVLLF